MKIVITGGHHSSALPVIQLIKKDHPEIEVYWIGHKRTLQGDKNNTLEYKEISDLGIPFYDLKAGKFYKTYNPLRVVKIPFGFIQALYYLLKIKPDIVLSFGGYLAVPVVFCSWLLKIPSITHEQTVVTGYANKFISKFVKKILISWKESEKYYPKDKIVLTGLPLRDSIFKFKDNFFNTNNNFPTIYITAGKTGSHHINDVVKEGLAELLSFCNVIHQCGDNSVNNDYEALKSLYLGIEHLSKGKYFLRKFVFENEIGEALNKSRLVISRSGAHITAELLALNKPCILIPISWSSHNEQYKNAKILEEYGLGTIIEEKELNNDVLVKTIKNVISDFDDPNIIDIETSHMIVKNAAKLILDEVIKISKKK